MSHKIKAVECVLDWNLWPRREGELDSTNLKRMREAMEAGVALPPIVVNQGDMRVVDGFHRLTATLDLYGDEAEIEADVRVYSTDAEMFLDAGRFNAIHGLPMSPLDKAHFIIKARRMRIPAPEIAKALGMQSDAMKEFLEKRSAMVKSTGERIPLAYGAQHLSMAEHGKDLNAAQEAFARTANGNPPSLHARMLLKALRANAIKWRESDIVLLGELNAEIQKVLKANPISEGGVS